ncbi:alpha/beta-hydrolase [Whalleya microplaca]|nr:alpha/beta-hydrolase [Whalleya microplaca]
MASIVARSDFIKTADGVRLSYSQHGPSSGPKLLFIPGWCQTGLQFKKQVEYFKKNFLVTTYDHRGHGDSDKPAYGYRIARLAADLDALLTQLDLRDVTLLGHSMGASVTWAHWDLFPHDRISKIVVIDQSPVMIANPAWLPEQATSYAALFAPEAVWAFANALSGPDGKATYEGLAKQFFSPDIAQADLEWALEQNFKIPLEHAATLFINHATIDWRDVLPRINVPTLVVAGKISLAHYQGIEWVASQIPGSQLETFEKEEGGSHCMFWENPEKFNRLVEGFLSS